LTSDPDRRSETRIDLRELDLQPERAGVLEYDAISTALDNGSPIRVQSQTIRVSIRDGKEHVSPAIDTSIPPCRASQLQTSGQPVKLGEHWETPMVYANPGEERDFARVYEFTNTSDQTCLVGGAPSLQFYQAPGRGSQLSFTACANCPNRLYRPRESQWFDLKAHGSAHFLVSTTVFDPDYWWLCNNIGTIELTLPGEGVRIPLPFEAAVCGQVQVSLWRIGAYDGDPMNLRYRSEGEPLNQRRATQAALPKECADADLNKLGTPILIERSKGVFFGLSAGAKSVVYGDTVPLYFWIINQTDQPQQFFSCDTGAFLSSGFGIFDSSGHRVRSFAEEKSPRSSWPASPCLISCTANIMFSVPAHTCVKPERSQNLAESYFLPAGQYVLRFVKMEDCSHVLVDDKPAELVDGLRIKIDPQ
jgi:hypothetical protein